MTNQRPPAWQARHSLSPAPTHIRSSWSFPHSHCRSPTHLRPQILDPGGSQATRGAAADATQRWLIRYYPLSTSTRYGAAVHRAPKPSSRLIARPSKSSPSSPGIAPGSTHHHQISLVSKGQLHEMKNNNRTNRAAHRGSTERAYMDAAAPT
ncbi:hypothetical protein PCL_03641 [Purpureocillium lilacinum]|uniref:Uncharacterized protein n=1 Tax=Purpureocillium lilacinum TaxID=33203 RepID=A0A2U3EPK6_PURLI|nr:hypothetical protein PCL_03641 [Purpureocillium lilacinum]